jgi:hypothetical protein
MTKKLLIITVYLAGSLCSYHLTKYNLLDHMQQQQLSQLQ